MKQKVIKQKQGCCVTGCAGGQMVTMASNGRVITLMCVHHALAWSKSNACREVAQLNPSASLAALSDWASAL